MTSRTNWTRQQLLVAFALYCRMPYGRLHHRNPEIIRYAEAIGRTPSALAMKLVNIASLDPAITTTGRRGLRAASAADRAMWAEMNTDWERFAVESQRALTEVEPPERLIAEPAFDYSTAPVGEDRLVQTTARIGHAFFRDTVLSAYNESCCITGLAVPGLLEAAHIVPWAVDPANRTNPHNGLAMTVLHHRAFDAGVITINDNMAVQVSRSYTSRSDEFFANAIGRYDGARISSPEKFAPDPTFLAYHRERIFQA